MNLTNIKTTLKKFLPIVVTIGLVVVIALLFLGREDRITTLRSAQANDDNNLIQLKQEYDTHAAVVEKHNKELTRIATEANTIREKQAQREQEIQQITNGKKS